MIKSEYEIQSKLISIYDREIQFTINNCSFNTSSNMWKYNKNKEALLTNFDILDQNVDFEKYKNFILKNSVENEYPNLN